MLSFEIPNIIDVSFSCKSSADATDSQEYTVHVDLSELTAEDIVEWMCNNGITVYVQGRIRAGKLGNGDTIKLHKPGTRSATIPISDEDYNRIRPNLEVAGIISKDMSRQEVEKIIRTLLKQVRRTYIEAILSAPQY